MCIGLADCLRLRLWFIIGWLLFDCGWVVYLLIVNCFGFWFCYVVIWFILFLFVSCWVLLSLTFEFCGCLCLFTCWLFDCIVVCLLCVFDLRLVWFVVIWFCVFCYVDLNWLRICLLYWLQIVCLIERCERCCWLLLIFGWMLAGLNLICLICFDGVLFLWLVGGYFALNRFDCWLFDDKFVDCFCLCGCCLLLWLLLVACLFDCCCWFVCLDFVCYLFMWCCLLICLFGFVDRVWCGCVVTAWFGWRFNFV